MNLTVRRDHQTAAFSTVISVMLVIVAVIISGALSQSVLERSPYLLSIAAVAISSWYGGSRQGLLTTVLAAIFVNYFLIDPRFHFNLSAEKIVNAGMFLIVAAIVNWMEYHRDRSAQALQEARDELRIILDNVADGITVQTEDGQPIFSNQAAAALMGYSSPAELTKEDGDSRARRFTLLNEEGEPVSNALPRTQVFRTGAAAASLLRVRFNATGQERWIYLKSAPVFDARRRAKIAVNVMQDVTMRKTHEFEVARMNEAAELQRKRLDRLITHVPGMVYDGVLDPVTGTQRLEFVSPYAERLFGYDVALIQNDPKIWENIIHPDDRASLEQKVVEQLKAGDSAQIEFRAIRKDETVITCEAAFTLTRDDEGKPVGTAGVIIDITKRKEAEEALRDIAVELRRSNEELEQFAYVASHDLQEPLRMVASYLQLVEQRYANQIDTDGKEFIAFAVDGASRMKILISDLLSYSRVQRTKIVMTQVSMEDALAQAKANLQVAIEDSQAVITHDPLPELTANESQMIQLLQNLIGNALKFKRVQPPAIHIAVKREPTEWLFSVCDNGIGIKSEYADRIFVIFQRLHARDEHPGTGIGLAICKKIVERHNGRIWVESTPGVGSNFFFSLPVTPRKMSNGSR